MTQIFCFFGQENHFLSSYPTWWPRRWLQLTQPPSISSLIIMPLLFQFYGYCTLKVWHALLCSASASTVLGIQGAVGYAEQHLTMRRTMLSPTLLLYSNLESFHFHNFYNMYNIKTIRGYLLNFLLIEYEIDKKNVAHCSVYQQCLQCGIIKRGPEIFAGVKCQVFL